MIYKVFWRENLGIRVLLPTNAWGCWELVPCAPLVLEDPNYAAQSCASRFSDPAQHPWWLMVKTGTIPVEWARLRWRVKWWLGQLQKSHAIITSDVWLPSDQRCALSPQWKETMAGWCGGVSWDVGDLIRGVSLPLRYPQTISVQGSTFIWGWHWRGHNYFHNQDVNDGILSKYKYTGYHSHQ